MKKKSETQEINKEFLTWATYFSPGGVSYKTPRLHRKSNLIRTPANILSLSIKSRINQNTKNNSNNSNSETAKPGLVVRMVESHCTQHYLH
jgi:hypothetical protein